MSHIDYNASFQIIQLLPSINADLLDCFVFESSVAYKYVVSEN